MNLRRKSIRAVYVLVTICSLLLLAGGGYLVYAAMTDTDKKENDFQIGQVETKLVEAFSPITEIPKNQSIGKDVTIKNTGTIKQFVRVMVLPEVRTTITGDPNNTRTLPLVIGKDLELEQLNTSEWKDGGDGYFYYVKEAVATGKSTTSLFKTVKLSSSLSDQYHDATFSLSLKVETINCNEEAYQKAWWQGTVPTDDPLKTINNTLKTMTDN